MTINARLTEDKERERERAEVIARLEAKRDEYVERLDIGVAKIEEAQSQGKDVQEWESFWVGLLRQYEAICDKLKELKEAK